MKDVLIAVLVALLAVETTILFLNRDAGWAGNPFAGVARVPPAPPASGADAAMVQATSGVPTYKAYVDKARRAAVLAEVMPFKMMVAEYNAVNGEFPERIADLGLAVGSMSSTNVRQVQVRGGTVIALPEEVDGWIALIPSLTMGGMNVSWKCCTNVESWIDDQCELAEEDYGVLEASFDCVRAETPVERLICRDEALIRLDRELEVAYRRRLDETPAAERAALTGQQQAWSRSRGVACRSLEAGEMTECVRDWTRMRIANLEAQVRPVK